MANAILAIYKKEIGYPFMCTARANLMNDELARILAEGGCQTISFGIETGNELIGKDTEQEDNG